MENIWVKKKELMLSERVFWSLYASADILHIICFWLSCYST